MPIDATEFGAITVNGKAYDHDVIIRLSGAVEKRRKRLSKELYGTSHIVSKAEVGGRSGWKRAVICRGKRVFRQEALPSRVAEDAGGRFDLQQVAREEEGGAHARDVLRRVRASRANMPKARGRPPARTRDAKSSGVEITPLRQRNVRRHFIEEARKGFARVMASKGIQLSTPLAP